MNNWEKLFFRKVNALIDQQYVAKQPAVLVGEVVGKMLENLLFNRKNETLDHVYASWLDSMSYKESFQPYLAKFNLPSGFDPWAVSLSHPFKQVDEQWLKEVGENLQNKDKLADFLIKISARHDNKQAQVVGINIWGDVKALIEFDGKHISYLSSLSETIGFYVSHFYKPLCVNIRWDKILSWV